MHQEAFEEIKRTVSEEVILAYPIYVELVVIYTDASTKQLGAVITENNQSITFFSQNELMRRQNTQSLNKNCHP